MTCTCDIYGKGYNIQCPTHGSPRWAEKGDDRMEKRYFKYQGEPCNTRGDYGEYVSGGHNSESDPEMIFVFDSDFGDREWVTIERGIESGDWQEISKEEWETL